MLEPWNDCGILPPPTHTYLSKTNIGIDDLKHTCNDMLKILENQSPLHLESAIISRFVYKFDKKFRNDLGFRSLRKTNTALRKYLKLNLRSDVENFSSVLPHDTVEGIYLPTRQMLEYLLVRIQTLGKIMQRICICSKQASVFYLDRVKRGESHWMSLMPYAVLCRIWSMCTVLVNYSCKWYSQMHQFLGRLQYKGLPFLPIGYNLPIDLKQWMDVKNLDEYGRFDWSENKMVEVSSFLNEEEDVDEFDIFQFVDAVNDNDCNVDDLKSDEILNNDVIVKYDSLAKNKIEDTGQSISRDSFKLCGNGSDIPKNENKIIGKLHSIENITGNNTLKQFLLKEEMYRNEQSEISLTKHLSFMQ